MTLACLDRPNTKAIEKLDMGASQPKPKENSNPSKKNDWLKLPPVPYVVKRITISERGHKLRDLAVAVVIADMMGAEGKGQSSEEIQVCFASLKTIARRAGCGKTTVQRSLDNTLCGGEAPLFKRTLGGVTRGYQHQCYRFELIRNPIAFVRGRDEARLRAVRGNFRQGGYSN